MTTSSEAVTAFQRDGFVRISSCIPLSVIKRAHDAIPELLARIELSFPRCGDCGGLHQDFDGCKCGSSTRPFIQLFNVWAQSAALRDLVFHRSISQTAEELLQCSKVRLIHDQLLIKRPDDLPTTPHIDGHYWPFDGRACTFWVPLAEVSDGMGTLRFYPHSHRWDLRRAELLLADEDKARQAIADFISGKQAPVGFELLRGDVTIHDKWSIHCASGNASSHNRVALAIHVMDARSRRTKTHGPMQQGHVELFHWEHIPERAELCDAVCPIL